ncbi:rod-determining factor RdfA [Natronoglomus mannanivorans]|uniref:rod-determining factor RdfA n=1 Tax=Natronoglomus mannanivorans TaxID=2979990 RepID=UPI003CCDC650
MSSNQHDTDTIDADITCNCKIGSGIEKYTQDAFHREIIRQYQDDDVSLRDLEERINKELVTGAIRRAESTEWGVASFDATPEEIVQALHTDEASPGEEKRIETRLKQAGIDTEALRKSFISYRTVKNHLNDCVDIDTSTESTITRTDARNTVGWARKRCEAVITRTVERLSKTGIATISDDFDVTVTPRVTCNECGDSMTISEFIGSDGCSCSDDDTDE